jgi:hypothetical protein
MTKTFDPTCYQLAAHFLDDYPSLDTEAARTTLAAAIQQCIEDELRFMRSVMEDA